MVEKQDRAARLGQALKAARRAAGLSRAAAAEAAGVSLSAAKAAEAGLGLVSTFESLAGAVGHRLAARQTGGPLDGLEAIRARAGSARAAARDSGLSRGAVEAVERGTRNARLVSLANYAAATGVALTLAPEGAALPFYAAAGNASGWHGWETPPALFDALEAAVGAFDLDPCAPAVPGAVRARRRYTEAQDGLTRPWAGRVFMNPPYGRSLSLWLAKAAAESEAGAEVFGLVPARPDTRGWHEHVAGRAGVLFLRGRLAFGDGQAPAPFPSALVLWNGKAGAFDTLRLVFPAAWAVPPGEPLQG